MDMSVRSAARNPYGMALLMVLLAVLVTLAAWPLPMRPHCSSSSSRFSSVPGMAA